MRIDAYNAVSQVYQMKAQVNKAEKEKKTTRDDKLELSQAGKDIAVAKKALTETPNIREDKVRRIKEQMAAGTYSVSAEDVADKMVSSMFGDMF